MTPPGDWEVVEEAALRLQDGRNEALPELLASLARLREQSLGLGARLGRIGDELQAAETEVARLREREAQSVEMNEHYQRKADEADGRAEAAELALEAAVVKIHLHDGERARAEARVKELDDMLVASEEHTQFHEARVKEMQAAVDEGWEWKGEAGRLEARVQELEERLQDCYDAGEHAVGERQDRILELERANKTIIKEDGVVVSRQARKITRLEEARDEALSLLNGIDYEEDSRVDRAVRALDF